MIKIQTMADVHALEADKHLPPFYVEVVKNQFLIWYEAESEGESLDKFSLHPIPVSITLIKKKT